MLQILWFTFSVPSSSLLNLFVTVMELYDKRTQVFFISVINQLDAQNFFFYSKFISCLYMFRAHVLIIKIALHSLWYHHAFRWPSRAQVLVFRLIVCPKLYTHTFVKL